MNDNMMLAMMMNQQQQGMAPAMNGMASMMSNPLMMMAMMGDSDSEEMFNLMTNNNPNTMMLRFILNKFRNKPNVMKYLINNELVRISRLDLLPLLIDKDFEKILTLIENNVSYEQYKMQYVTTVTRIDTIPNPT